MELFREFNLGNVDGPIVTDINTTDATCGQDNGTATLLPANFTYDWGAVLGVGNTQNNLVGDTTYSVTVSESGNSCENIIEVTIGEQNDLTATYVINSQPTCGEFNGSVTINATGGSGNYDYSWGSGPTRDDLSATVSPITVTITDVDSDCSAEVDIILQDDILGGAIVDIDPNTQISCHGANDATLVYNIDYDPNFVEPATVILRDEFGNIENNGNLSAGTWCIVVIDGNGCVAGQDCHEITEPDAIDVNFGVVNADCDNPLGAITITATGGTGTLNYDWADLSGTNNDQNRIDLPASGTYSVTVTDLNGCSVAIGPISIANDCPIDCEPFEVISEVIQDASCGEFNGSIILDVTGDENDYSYAWTDNVSNSHIADSLMGDVYTVTITQNSDPACTIEHTVIVDNLDGPLPTVVSVSPATCGDSDGGAQLSPTSFLYIWRDLDGNIIGNGSTQSSLPAGEYLITTIDNNTGCENVLSVVIDNINSLSADVVISSQPDCNMNNGAITINVSGGSGEYTFGNTSNLGEGADSTLVIDDVTGCQLMVHYVLEANVPNATITVDPILTLPCAGDQNGTVNYTVSYDAGFVGTGREEIQLAGVPVSNGSLTVGDYVIVVYDDNDCLAGTAPFTVVAPESIEVTFASTDGTCTEGGTINLDIIGGTPPYNVNWNIPGTNNPEDLMDLLPGNYSAVITDANDCVVNVPAITIATSCDPCSTPPVIVNIQTTGSNCGIADGTAQVNVIGNVNDFTYSWSDPSLNNGTNTVANLVAGLYSVTVTNNSDITCYTEQSFVIDNNQAPNATIADVQPATCTAADGEVTLSPASLTYTWPDAMESASRNDLAAGTYDVTVSENGNGCTNVIEVVIESISNLEVTHTVDNAPSCGNADGVVAIVINNGSGQYITNPTITNNTMTDLSAGGPYAITVTDIVTGCMSEYEFRLTENIVNAVVTVEPDIMVSCIGEADATAILDIDYNTGFVQPAQIKFLQDSVEVINGELSVGNYCVEVRDGNDCLAGMNCFEVTAPELLIASASLNNITCDDNGSILLTVTGGTPPYSYAWSNGDTISNPVDLQSGFYTVTIMDANACETTFADLSIIDECNVCETPVIASTIITNATCDNADGSIRIEMEGSGYLFNWNPVNINNEITNLTAGPVYVTITDANDPTCYITETFVIGNADGPQDVTVMTTDATCDNNDGIATLEPSSYDYVWENGNTTDTRNDLSPGITYVVTVIDPGTNCVDIINVEVGSTNPLSASVVINTLPSCGVSNGSVTIVPTGGSGNYEYGNWPSDTRTDLSSGPDSLIVRDIVTGCTFYVEFILPDNTQDATITIINDNIDLACADDANGTVMFDVVYDAGFALPADTMITRNGDNTDEINGALTAGNYCVVIRDANDCIAAAECFVVNEPPVLSLDAILTDISCEVPIGNIDLVINGGTAPFTIDWNDTINPTDPEDNSDLSVGEYSVTVTDANGCVAILEDLPIVDNCPSCEETPIVVNNIALVDATCGLQNGSAIIDVQGNVSDYFYTWYPNVSNSHEAFNLLGGSYSVTITHQSNGDCVTPEPINFVIGSENGPQAEIVSNIPANCTAADGQVTLSPDTLIYEWSDGGFGAVRSDLRDSTYLVTVKDPNSTCQNFIEVTVTSVSNLIANAISNTAADCGVSNGSATIEVLGGSGNYNYNNNWGANATRTDLAAGNYPVTITDQVTGCQAEVVVEILDDVPAANITLQLPILTNCPGSADATANYTITVDPGYQGTPVVTIEDIDGTVYTNGNLSAGDYCLMVRDSNNCLSQQTCFAVTEPLPMTVSVNVTNKDCDNSGSIDLMVSNGAGGYLFDWEDLDRDEDPQNRIDLAGGIYEVTITDASGCTFILDDIIVIDECNNCNISTTITTNDPDCGLSDGAIQITGLGNYTYLWSDGSTNSNLTGLSAGTYRVTISDVNDLSCFEVKTIPLTNPSAPVATASVNAASCLAANGSATLTPSNLFYQWENADGISYGTGATKNNLLAGLYYVSVASGTSNCIDILTVQIEQNNPLTVSAAVISEPGCEESNGSVEILVSGGSGDYRYDLDPTNLPAGTYTANVLDQITGCTESVTFTLENSVAAGANITVDPLLLLDCAGDENGSALYNISYDPGFITPVDIAFVDSTGTPVNNGSLTAGNYCVIVMNGDSCLAGSACFEVVEPEGMNVAISVSNETCASAGAINTAVMGGNPGYTYTWADTTLTTTNRTGLAAGTYQLTITDANGCQAIFDNLIVNDECSSNDCDNLIVTNIISFDATCDEDNGSSTVNILGNNLDYMFNCSN